jgi:hypothetical protein
MTAITQPPQALAGVVLNVKYHLSKDLSAPKSGQKNTRAMIAKRLAKKGG